MNISVVIPTHNRKKNLTALLGDINRSEYPVAEVIIVDSGSDKLSAEELAAFEKLTVRYCTSVPSVCVQRNIGIRLASSEWIFLCDDDIEMPADYLQNIYNHVQQHPEAGALSGLVLQQEKGNWVHSYPVKSSKELLLKYIFGLGIWGEIECKSGNPPVRNIINHYKQKKNYISKAGMPVITDYSGEYSVVPVYGLGASIIKKEWLEASPYDEVLDRYGIGDNYGVAAGFPELKIHLLHNTFVYHHQAPSNRMDLPLRYYRRMLALHYFIKREKVENAKGIYFVWALIGNLLIYIFSRNALMIRSAYKTLVAVLFKKNPYEEAHKYKRIITEPMM